MRYTSENRDHVVYETLSSCHCAAGRRRTLSAGYVAFMEGHEIQTGR